METISGMATAARKSVFGDTTATTPSGTEPPAGGAPGKGSPDAPHDPGNIPAQLFTQPGIEPPSGGARGKGTAAAPFDPGNELEQAQVTGSTTDTTEKTAPLSSTSIPASKIASTEAETKPKKAGTAKVGSHSALFGLGPKQVEGNDTGALHPPNGSGELYGTIDEADETTGKQADMQKKAFEDEDTGGYVGLKKAAMEEEEKRRNNGGNGFGAGGFGASANQQSEEPEREPRSREHKNSLGREISPGEMPDGTHRKSIAEGMPLGHSFSRKSTQNSSTEKSSGGGGFREKMKEKFRSKK